MHRPTRTSSSPLITKLAAAGLLASVSSLTAGCGGGSCGAEEGCGGDPVGTWDISNLCIEEGDGSMMGFDGCDEATVNFDGLNASGTATFGADGTYSTTTVVDGSARFTLPSSCLSQNGISIQCDQLETLFALLLAEEDSPFEGISCSGSSSCSCTMTFKPIETSGAGTYQTSGGTITLDGQAGEYCVEEGQMTLINASLADSGLSTGRVRLVLSAQ